MLGARHAPATVYDLDRVGKPAPALTLTRLDGSPLALRALRGKPAYVFLYGSWCAPCMEALPAVVAAYRRYGDRIRFVGVDMLESRAAAAALAARAALPFEIAVVEPSEIDPIVDPDTRQRGGAKYLIPADFLLDADGIVRDAWHGVPVSTEGVPQDVVPARLQRLLSSADSVK